MKYTCTEFAFYYLAIATGVSQGELLVLMWKNVDLEFWEL